MKRIALSIISFLLILFAGLYTWARLTTLHPAETQEETVSCAADAPQWDGRPLKVMSWNVQYMAGKSYVFFYDLPDGSGPDERPSHEEIEKTTLEVARVINDEKPDVILLQELDDGASKTDYRDQLADVLGLLTDRYPCHASAFYMKSAFTPHPHIRGATGMKLSTISRYRMSKAIRHQLPTIPDNFVVKLFNFKRAVLEVRIPTTGKEAKKEAAFLNTHTDAFAQGTTTMQDQIDRIHGILSDLKAQGIPFVIGGDFNLLPPEFARTELHASVQVYYNDETEIAPLFRDFAPGATIEQLTGKDGAKFFTAYPNNPIASGPDRTIDYLFYDGLKMNRYYVRQHDTLKISDHLPLVGEFALP